MAKLIDLTGKHFGKLLVLRRDTSKKGTYWLCQCNCGNIISTRRDTLTRKNNPKTSCGCDLAQKNSKAHLKDETGKKYGKLVVIKRVKNQSKYARWLCKCDCGNYTEVNGSNLRNGSVQSCGCKRFESHNAIDETGHKYGKLLVLYRSNKKTQSSHVFWHCKCDCGNEYDVDGTYLRLGITTSCLQCARSKNGIKHRLNLVGQRFGKLTVLGCNEERTKKEKRTCWICKCDCGNYTEALGSNLINGNVQSCGCLVSKGEKEIESLLIKHRIKYKTQFIFPDLKDKDFLRFDFAILNQDDTLSHLIEYDGIQHFKPIEYFGGEKNFKNQQRRDNIKNDYCQNNNIKLIRIRYDEPITLEKILGI